jgi:hypothetical protein
MRRATRTARALAAILSAGMGKSEMKVRSLVVPMVAAIGIVSSTATPSKAWYYGYGYDPAPAIFAGAALGLFTGFGQLRRRNYMGIPMRMDILIRMAISPAGISPCSVITGR